MKQIIQHLNNGTTELIELPVPAVAEGHLLIQTSRSLVSMGTERMLVEFGRANWWNKALQQPERVRQVLDKVKTDGLKPTIEAVRSKINRPIPLGYANVGRVVAVGQQVSGFQVGDRVVSNGPHAEYVLVSQQLAAKVPDNVDDDDAVFTVVSSIVLQGIRLIQPTFGETVVVYGLGLLGQIAAQLLHANGCKVLGIDADEGKCAALRQLGFWAICNKDNQDIVASVLTHNNCSEVDAVLICASAQKDTIVGDSAKMCRKRGRVVLVGVVELQLNRSDFYEKELTFQVSASYGPGRYEYDYEKKAADYPVGFVRWTAQRNFEAVLQAMSGQRLHLHHLIQQKLTLAEYDKIYSEEGMRKGLNTIFVYPDNKDARQTIRFKNKQQLSPALGQNGLALIGAGAYASKIIAPYLSKLGLPIEMVTSAQGLSATQLALQYKIALVSTNNDEVFANPDIQTVLIATQHNLHADLCVRAIKAKKHVFVEKPLAITLEELECINTALHQSPVNVNVGFNRRHSALSQRAKQLLASANDINIVITVNAGVLPSNHWLSDAKVSGGRIVGELCHFIDLATYFSGSLVHSLCANALAGSEDDFTLMLRFVNGCSATIHYFTNGNKGYDKERIELYSAGKTIIIENWKKLKAFGFKSFSDISVRQDKGHQQQFKLLTEQIKTNGASLIPFDSLYNTTVVSILAKQSLRDRQWITL